MGILNLTPDSFSDGGKFLSPRAALKRAEQLLAENADILDLGAESTRPGSLPVSARVQLQRLLPVLRAIRRRHAVPLSIDTQSAEVAEACLAEGATIINDVSALRQDTRMLALLARNDCPIVLMHMQGSPRRMQKNPRYKDVVADIVRFFRERITICERMGIDRKRLIVDPGIGFGKTLDHNIELLQRLREFKTLKCPILIGVSRKSFLGKLSGQAIAEKRVAESVAAGLVAVANGASILRVHDVAAHVAALRIARALN